MAERAHPDDPGFQGTIYETRLRERYAFTLPLISGRDVLDAPCGTGWGTAMLAGARSVVGLDAAPEAIAYARERFPGPRYEEGRLEALPFSDAEFDVVICLEGLEHLPLSDARRFLAHAWRTLRPDGILVVTAPLLKGGRHSGNPHHLYEFEERELRDLLGVHFAPEDVAVVDGGDSPELRFVGRRRASPGAQARPTDAGLARAERARAWTLGLARGDGFAFADGHADGLLGTCFAVLVLEGLGALDGVTAERRGAWAAFIGAAQRPEDGLFADPLLADHPPGDEGHDAEYLLHQMTYFALHALDALEERPPHPLRFAERFERPAELRPWLAGLDWSNAWLQSNRVMFALDFLLRRAEDGDAGAAAAIHAALDWLDEAQDPETGLWGIKEGSSRLNAMAAAYHFLPFYDHLRRPISRVDRIIDATLALQQPDGLFAASAGGGACEDLDAIDVLAICARISGHRRDDVRRALLRAFWAIWNAQNPDGGFGYAQALPGATYRFSGWAPLEQELRLSDSWATFGRLIALATIRRLYPDDTPPLPWRFRRRPALGYHRFDDAIAPQDEAAIVHTLRPLPAPSPLAGAEPRVSVVIPCYNLGSYLHEALASALGQTLQPVEVLVVDDGSSDPFTRLLLDRLDHPQVRVLRQENRGLPAARNAGIRAARAAAICCLDADDRLRPEFLERALPLLEADAQVGFVSSFYQEFDGRDAQLRYASCDLPEMLVTNRAMVASLFRREAWERAGGYCEELTGMQDWDLWIGMLEAGYRGAVVPEVLFEYRVRPGSMYTTTRRPEHYGRLRAQIVARHQGLFERWHREVIAGQAVEFARLVEYVDGQVTLVRQLQQLPQGDLAARDYHAGQAAAWQGVAEQYEAARDYHAGQAANWQQAAAQQAELIAQQAELIARQAELIARWRAFVPSPVARALGALAARARALLGRDPGRPRSSVGDRPRH